MSEHYTIKELAEAKGTSAPVRYALLEMETRLMQAADRIEQLEVALVEAAIPLEAMTLAGTVNQMCDEMRMGVADALIHIRAALEDSHE